MMFITKCVLRSSIQHIIGIITDGVDEDLDDEEEDGDLEDGRFDITLTSLCNKL